MNERFYLRLVILFCGLCFMGSIIGCSNAGQPTSVNEKIQIWKEVTSFMKEHNLSGNVTLNMTGTGEVYLKESAGLDTGVSVHASAQFNSATKGTPLTNAPE